MADTSRPAEHKTYRFKVRQIDETGAFEGLASTYGNVDQGGDVIEPGAFDRTLKNGNGEVPILWSHDPTEPIGLGRVSNSEEGLVIQGKLELSLPAAQKVYVLLKSKIVRGLSIGYQTLQSVMDKGVRRIKEVKLFEVSVVTFPMNSEAVVTAVKAALASRETKEEFEQCLEYIQAMSAHHQIMDALGMSIYSTLWDSEMTADEKVASIDQSIQQFHSSMMQAIPRFLAAIGTPAQGGEMVMMAKMITEAEAKIGRRISAASKDKIRGAIEALQALLEDEPADDGTSSKGLAPHTSDPDSLHSQVKEAFAAVLQKNSIERAFQKHTT